MAFNIMLKFKFLFITSIILVGDLTATQPSPMPRNKAPYPAAGFRPNIAFHLPKEYLPPIDATRQRQSEKGDIEIQKQRVDFIGQFQGNSLLQNGQPLNPSLSVPSNVNNDDTESFLRIQNLPSAIEPQKFKPSLDFAESQKEHRQNEPERASQLMSDFKEETIRLAKFGDRLQPRPSAQSQYLAPIVPKTQGLTQDISPQERQKQDPIKPSELYGSPKLNNYPDPRNLPQGGILTRNSDIQEENQAAIKTLNSAVEAYNRAAQDDNETDREDIAEEGPVAYSNRHHKKGQYYVLGPDNTVQRVMFTTTQDESEARNNGFTAELKYTPVGEVRDPVFKYNNQGQLVRLFK